MRPTEKVALGKALEEIEKPNALKRMGSGSSSVESTELGSTRNKVASPSRAVGAGCTEATFRENQTQGATFWSLEAYHWCTKVRRRRSLARILLDVLIGDAA